MAFQDKRNNPGNLKFANQPGAIGADEKGFAVFPDPDTGMKAMRRQIELDLVQRGKTGREFIYKYAPPSDNNPTDAYVQNVFGELGIDPDKPVDPAKIPDIQRLMVRQEHGKEGMQHYYSGTPAAADSPTSSAPALATAAAVGGGAVLAKNAMSQDQEEPAPERKEQDIGTLGQYRGLSPLYSQLRASRIKSALASRKKMQPRKAVAESTVRFKDLRKRIYEQIIKAEEE